MSANDLRALRERLLERFVAGEIDKATYDQILGELQTVSLPPTPEGRPAPPAVPARRSQPSRHPPVAQRTSPPPPPAVTAERPQASRQPPVARGVAPPPPPAVPAGRRLPPLPVLIACGGGTALLVVLVPVLILLLHGRARPDSRDGAAVREPRGGAPANPTPAASEEHPRQAAPSDKPVPPSPSKQAIEPPPPPEPEAPAIGSPLSLPREGSVANAKWTITIDQAGNGQLMMEFRLNVGLYTSLRRETPNKAVLLRKFGLRDHWCDLQDIRGGMGGEVFEDSTSTVCIKCMQPGRARIRRGDLWETTVGDALELASLENNVALFMGASVGTDLGLITQKVYVQVPKGARDLTWVESGARLTYRLSPDPAREGNRSEARFDWEVRPQVMTCLAKLYANRKFPNLWVARAVLRNTGNQTLKNYHIHFKVPDYTTNWSPWERYEQVVPGEAVVDAYFPLFDLDKLANLKDIRDTTLEVEYEYQKGDGETVHETDSKPFKLLGRNQVIFSSMRAPEAVDYQDRYDYAPYFVASFVTPNDPIVQRVAGMVTRQVGGGEFSLRDAEARKFLRGLYEFLAANKISYQTPDGGEFDHRAGQYIKYARDVLDHKAGTCIDLAICYASVCKAVGLKAKMFLVRNHCFPAVILPEEDRLLAVETSAIGRSDFDEAVKRGKEEVEEARQGTQFLEVDIQARQNAGVASPDLPDLPEDVLDKWGIRAVEGGDKVPLADRKLDGIWRAEYTIGGPGGRRGAARVQFKGNTFERTVTEQGTNSRTARGTYTYSAKDGLLTLNYSAERVSVTFDITWLTKDRIEARVLKSSWQADEGQKLVFDRND